MDGIAALVQQLHRVWGMQQYQLLPCCQARVPAVASPALVSVLLLAAALLTVVGVCMPPEETAGRELVNLVCCCGDPAKARLLPTAPCFAQTHTLLVSLDVPLVCAGVAMLVASALLLAARVVLRAAVGALGTRLGTALVTFQPVYRQLLG